MCTDIDAVGQSADDDSRRICRSQPLHQTCRHRKAVLCAAPCAYDANDTRGIEAVCAAVINHRRGIGAGAQAGGIGLVRKGIDTDAVPLGEVLFAFGTLQGCLAIGCDALGRLAPHAGCLCQLPGRSCERLHGRTEVLQQRTNDAIAHTTDHL